jgi:D-cysteine desulfhydrase
VIPEGRKAPVLFDVFPELSKVVPWTPLAHVPTAVEPCSAIAEWLGRGGVYMKRDDLISPLYGGNKVRRYEFVLADAMAQGAKHIVTAGGLASTQVMATALFGRALGLGVTSVLFDQPVTTFAQAQIRRYVQAGAQLVYGGGYLRTAYETAMAMRRSPGSYLILPGAANALANLGYIDAMLELGRQVEQGITPKPDVIMLPTGSSGTLAALALGAAYLGWDTEILGVRITSSMVCNRASVGFVIRNTDRFMGRHVRSWGRRWSKVNFTLYGGALGRGYGARTPEATVGIEQLRVLTGSPGEVTYSGKALAALHALCNTKTYASKSILLWNTLSSVHPELAPVEHVPAALSFVMERVTKV